MFLNMFRIVRNLLLTEILAKVKKKTITVGGTITKFKRNDWVFGKIIEQKKHLINDTYYLIIIVIELI